MGESAKTTWGFIIQNRIFFLFLFFAKVGGGGGISAEQWHTV